MSAVSRSSSSGPVEWPLGGLFRPNDASYPALNQSQLVFEPGRCRRGGARGLEVSPRSLGEDHLVQSQITDCAPKTGLSVLDPSSVKLMDLAELRPRIIFTIRDADSSKSSSPEGYIVCFSKQLM